MIGIQCFEELESSRIRQRHVEDETVEDLGLHLLQALSSRHRSDDLDVFTTDQRLQSGQLDRIVFDDQHRADAMVETTFNRGQRLNKTVATDWLQHVADGALRQSLMRIIFNGSHVDGNVSRPQIALQPVEHRESGMIR